MELRKDSNAQTANGTQVLTLPPRVPLPFDCVIKSAREELRRFSTSAMLYAPDELLRKSGETLSLG